MAFTWNEDISIGSSIDLSDIVEMRNNLDSIKDALANVVYDNTVFLQNAVPSMAYKTVWCIHMTMVMIIVVTILVYKVASIGIMMVRKIQLIGMYLTLVYNMAF